MFVRIGRHLFPLLLVLFVSALDSSAEQLPIKAYTTTDGLARNDVECIKQDSHGFLWFCTGEGLSRFDGYRFVNYGAEQGLPGRNINDLIETHDGTFFVATSDGLAKMDAGAASSTNQNIFSVYRPDGGRFSARINVIVEDRNGVIWCATNGGLLRFDRNAGGGKFTRVPAAPIDQMGWGPVTALLVDRENRLWIGTEDHGVTMLAGDATYTKPSSAAGPPMKGVKAFLEDQSGRIWFGAEPGLFNVAVDGANRQLLINRLGDDAKHKSLAEIYPRAIVETGDAHLWIAGRGLTEIDPLHNFSVREYGLDQGLSDISLSSVCQDSRGNLWIGSETGGVMKLAPSGFVAYHQADGLSKDRIAAIFERRDGKLCAVVNGSVFNTFDGERFKPAAPKLPVGVTGTWGWNQISFQDTAGDWWIASDALYRYASGPDGGPSSQIKSIYKFSDAAVHGGVFRLFEDSKHDIWVSIFSRSYGLARWNRATDKVVPFNDAGLAEHGTPTAFREDNAGDLWIGFYQGGVARFRNGRFTFFDSKDGVAGGFIRDIFLDHQGRLWIASTSNGLSRVDDPAAEHPAFKSLTASNGLASNEITCFVEDRHGNLYVGTGRGLDRLDPATNHIRHYSTADGLPDDFINVAFGGSDGSLWFGTLRGLARLLPQQDPQRNPPPIMIGGIRVAGALRPVAEIGATNLSGLVIGPNQNQLQIDFFSIEFTPGEIIRFQYQLEGVDRDWSAPTTDRSVNYAQLAAGNYRFLVRALNSEDVVSSAPAVISFRVLPPFWRRWWFVIGVLLFASVPLAAIVYYRRARWREQRRAEADLRQAREERFRELERVRRRIASDLHDDLGSSLTQISLLSEVVRQRLHDEDDGVTPPWKMIARSSRELVDAMSDIVWAINPQKDHLSDLVQRMRSLASDLFTAKHIEFRFAAPAATKDIVLGANLRREIFLIFKESLNNVVRHAQASFVEIVFAVEDGQLLLQIDDNGIGFDAAAESEGHGLVSMRTRSQDIRGTLTLKSTTGAGSTTRLTVPLRETEADRQPGPSLGQQLRRISRPLIRGGTTQRRSD